MRFTVESKYTIGSFIIRLFRSYCPTHITGFVISVVINPVQFMLRRWRHSDLVEYRIAESFEIEPIRMNQDTAASVVFVAAMMRIAASLFDAVPAMIKLSTIALPMSSVRLSDRTRTAKTGCAFLNGMFPGHAFFAAAGTGN
jgi:hypothetical protein